MVISDKTKIIFKERSVTSEAIEFDWTMEAYCALAHEQVKFCHQLVIHQNIMNEINPVSHVNLLSVELKFYGFDHSIEVLNESCMFRLFVSFNSIKFFIQIAKNPRKIPINFQ
jgi:hypothetical protein